MGFDLEKGWGGFKALPDKKPDLLIDTAAINKRLAARSNNPLRRKTGTFQLPKGVTAAHIRNAAQAAANKWLRVLEGQGWALNSRLQLEGPFLARDITTKAALLDMDEYRL